MKMTKKIVLACAGGFSTSMLVSRMKDAMVDKGLDYEIIAIGEDDIDNHSDADVYLLGPQIGHQLDYFEQELDKPVSVIEHLDYGTMNGGNVLDMAIRLMEENND